MNLELSNRQLWALVGVTLAVYLILVLEDIAYQLSRNRYIVLKTIERDTSPLIDVTPNAKEPATDAN